jgi:hypothetical protein
MPTRVLLRATLVSELVWANWRFHSGIAFFLLQAPLFVAINLPSACVRCVSLPARAC